MTSLEKLYYYKLLNYRKFRISRCVWIGWNVFGFLGGHKMILCFLNWNFWNKFFLFTTNSICFLVFLEGTFSQAGFVSVCVKGLRCLCAVIRRVSWRMSLRHLCKVKYIHTYLCKCIIIFQGSDWVVKSVAMQCHAVEAIDF